LKFCEFDGEKLGKVRELKLAGEDEESMGKVGDSRLRT
jgi:hypothetical protein